MSSGRHFLLLILSLAAAVAAAWFLPQQFPAEVSPQMGYVIGGFVFAAGALLVMNLRQRATVHQCADIMGQINEAVGLVIADQRRIEEQMTNIQGALSTLEAEPQRDVGEVVAEVKVLQSLIEQLYQSRGTAAAAPAQTPSPMAPVAPPTLRVVDNPNAARRPEPAKPAVPAAAANKD